MKESKRKKQSAITDIELHEDAWPRFERFIKAVAKAGPQHRPSKDKPTQSKNPAKRKAVEKRER